jgi:hypothetical protein
MRKLLHLSNQIAIECLLWTPSIVLNGLYALFNGIFIVILEISMIISISKRENRGSENLVK